MRVPSASVIVERRIPIRIVMSIRVCIADDHLLILTVRRALEASAGIEVVGATQRGDEVVALFEEQRPDLVLLDHRMPGADGITWLKLIK